MPVNEIDPTDYQLLLGEIKQRIRSAQYEALKAVNQALLALYWDIGQSIVTRQQGETWGKSVVERLAEDLQTEFPGVKGFSSRNIWNMRNFYLTYQQNEKLQPMVAEIGWTHNIIILEKCKDDLEREFYIRMTRKFGWTKNVLIHQIDRGLRCLVAIDLKIGEFVPEYVGKMQFYLAALDDRVRVDDEQPSVGIILCKSKDRTIVEYALRESNKPIGVATYRIVSAVPQELKHQLPEPEQVALLLEGIEE